MRQSSPGQVERHKEGRLRQYQLVDWAATVGWTKERTVAVDDDQGKSGSSPNARSGFARLVSAVGRGEVGIVVALEVKRLARNSPDWHNLIFMCRWTDTLITDGQMIYDPSQSNDRMILGVRSQLGALELDHAIERMMLARWNKAERGEMMTIPPAGNEIDDSNELVMSSDEAVIHAIATVFSKFDELGTAPATTEREVVRRSAGQAHCTPEDTVELVKRKWRHSPSSDCGGSWAGGTPSRARPVPCAP